MKSFSSHPIYGYAENSSVWNVWRTWLCASGFSPASIYTVTFTKDYKCGTVKDHSSELVGIINNNLRVTHSQKINVVAHSKGGFRYERLHRQYQDW